MAERYSNGQYYQWLIRLHLGLAVMLLAVDRSTGDEVSPGRTLYTQHCAGCHGANGDGLGIGAQFLFPKPRNFQTGRFKLVSTDNYVPSESDLDAVLVRGMPGSSMPSWGHLTPEERQQLIAEIYRLVGEGFRQSYIASLRADEELTDEELQQEDLQAEINDFVASKVTPGTAVQVPAITVADDVAIARGKLLFEQKACASCHGLTGKGDGVKQMLDDDGTPTRPRDLTRGIYKGGHDPASLYLRVVRGLPGTPMPSAPTLTPEESLDLVHFLRSLSTEERRQAAVLRRQGLQVARIASLPAGGSDADWDGIAPVDIQTFPLWWRDDAEPQLQFQAVHDGQTLKVRLRWSDTTSNASAVKPDEFEDMVAVELYRGPAEPFLGMGADQGVVDLWAWRAGHDARGEERSILDDYPFDTPVYEKLAGPNGLPDFVTARVVGNPIAIRPTTAASLGAKGPGSSTFLPRPSQAVSAEASWADGTWTVVLTRPLVVEADGLSVTAGESCSIAFAIWDGAFRERGGQKLVSMWNDLELK